MSLLDILAISKDSIVERRAEMKGSLLFLHSSSFFSVRGIYIPKDSSTASIEIFIQSSWFNQVHTTLVLSLKLTRNYQTILA